MSDTRDNWREGDQSEVPEQSSTESLEPKVEKMLSQAQPERSGKEWKLIEKLLNGLFIEQRRARRWGIFFKLLTFGYLFGLLAVFLAGPLLNQVGQKGAQSHTAVVELVGPIAAQEAANADQLIWSLRRAFEAEQSKAVVIRINSPGGSPVQSGYIYDEIVRLRGLYPEKPLYAVITDIGASGAYYVAAAADQIYADKASLVGSIGVVSSGFGFVGLMDKLGVERRALTAGDNKALLDPFSPLDPQAKKFWQTVLDTTHQQFIEQVKKGRGDRLVADDPELFSGLVWTGEQALEKGLIDGLGSTSYVARELVGEERLVDYSPQPSPLEQIVEQLGVSVATTLATELGVSKGWQLQ